jgi:hypothetical protein
MATTGAPAVTLLRRAHYGGRKGRRAWRRLGEFRMTELAADGVEIVVLGPDEPVPDGPYIVFRRAS